MGLNCEMIVLLNMPKGVGDEVVAEPGQRCAEYGLPVHLQSEEVWYLSLDGVLTVLSGVDHAQAEEEDSEREHDAEAEADAPNPFACCLVVAC